MSKKCPYSDCGSYNTESKVSGNIGYGMVQVTRFASAGVACIVGGLFGHAAGHAAGHGVLRETKDWGKDIKRYHCCNCGRDF